MSPGSQRAVPEREFAAEEMPTNRPEPVRVCHIASGDLWAGAEVNTTTLLKALAGEPGLRLNAILLNEGKMARRLRSYGIEVKVSPESEHSFLGIVSEAARFLRSEPVHILHSHRYKENLLSVLLAQRCRIPYLVCTFHGAPEPFRGWRHVKHRAIGYLDFLVARYWADQVISLSDELRNTHLRHLPAHKVITIRTGVDTEHVGSKLTKAEAKRRLGIPEHLKVVGYSGRLVPIKRLDIFFKAAKQIAEMDSAITFVIAGDGPEKAQLEAFADDFHLKDRVRFLGFREDVYDVMRAFDVFTLCSDHEGLPRTILEAMYLGVPVVARAVGGIPEVVEDGVSGILIGPNDPNALADTWRALITDEKRRTQLAAAGLAVAERSFSARKTASEMIEVYRGLGKLQ